MIQVLIFNLRLEEIIVIEDDRGILLCYIDDNPEDALGKYLFDFTSKHKSLEYSEHKFLPNKESYDILLNSQQVSKSDIIIIDSKLFENKNAPTNDIRLTGEKFKTAIKADFPYKKVLVISSKTIANDSVTISKFNAIRSANALEESQKYYEEKLEQILEFSVQEIKEQREIIPELKAIPDIDKVKAEKIANMEQGIKELDEIKKSDIDLLVNIFQEIKDGYDE